MEYRIRRLRKSDGRKSFESGQPDPDHFFWRYAGQNRFKHHIGVTYVAAFEDTIMGFMTVAMGSMEADELPGTKRLPQYYSLPILRLERLAVDKRYQKMGIGKQLLRHSLLLALQQSETVGCIGVIVDAKPEAVDFYLQYGFQLIDDIIERELRGSPPPRPMFLPLESIGSASHRCTIMT